MKKDKNLYERRDDIAGIDHYRIRIEQRPDENHKRYYPEWKLYPSVFSFDLNLFVEWTGDYTLWFKTKEEAEQYIDLKIKERADYTEDVIEYKKVDKASDYTKKYLENQKEKFEILNKKENI